MSLAFAGSSGLPSGCVTFNCKSSQWKIRELLKLIQAVALTNLLAHDGTQYCIQWDAVSIGEYLGQLSEVGILLLWQLCDETVSPVRLTRSDLKVGPSASTIRYFGSRDPAGGF